MQVVTQVKLTAHMTGLVPATSPCDKSLQHVSATSPIV